jgi:hypothetical protein
MSEANDSLFTIISSLIDDKIEKTSGLQYYLVTDVNPSKFTVSIKHPNFKKSAFNDVPISSIALGHNKGIMSLPAPGDLVLVGFLGKGVTQPIVLGNVFNTNGQYPQIIPQIKQNEMLLAAQSGGAFIVIRQDNSIILKAKTGAKIKINLDGSFKLFNKNNYGIECDASGNITIRGTSINHTQTPGSF